MPICTGCGQRFSPPKGKGRPRTRCEACGGGATTRSGLGTAWQKLRPQILARDGHTCRYCGGSATTVDHIIPRTKGGTDDPDNLVAACGSCNYRKGDRLPPSQRASQPPLPGSPRLVYTIAGEIAKHPERAAWYVHGYLSVPADAI